MEHRKAANAAGREAPNARGEGGRLEIYTDCATLQTQLLRESKKRIQILIYLYFLIL